MYVMRDYLSGRNLVKSMLLSAVITLMSMPRISVAELRLSAHMPAELAEFLLCFYVLAAFLVMTLIAGAVFAWGRHGGMAGPFPSSGRMFAGVGIAAAVVCVILPVNFFWISPLFRAGLKATGNDALYKLQYPATVGGCLAFMLWMGSFETMFLRAAPLAFLARLTGNKKIAVAFAVCFQVALVVKRLALEGIGDHFVLFTAASAATGLISCLLYVRYGLPATMVFCGGVSLHLLLSLEQ